MSKIDIKESHESGKVTIKLIGIGGAGGNALNNLVENGGLDVVDTIAINTDVQALSQSKADVQLQIGTEVTRGLGAGSNPEIGRKAAEEDIDKIKELLEDTDLLFLTAGLGGGTGSGATPVVARLAREMGILSIAIVTTPFSFEGRRRMQQAIKSLEELRDSVDTIIVLPNQRLLENGDTQISMLDAFAQSNQTLIKAIRGIAEIITKPGHINVDFADVRTVMSGMGFAVMGMGSATGEDRARQAVVEAINSPFSETTGIDGAKSVLINITGGPDLGLYEINLITSIVHEMVSDNADIILGSVVDEESEGRITVTVIAAGIERAAETYALATSHIGTGAAKAKIPLTTNDGPSAIPDGDDEWDIPTFIRRAKEKNIDG